MITSLTGNGFSGVGARSASNSACSSARNCKKHINKLEIATQLETHSIKVTLLTLGNSTSCGRATAATRHAVTPSSSSSGMRHLLCSCIVSALLVSVKMGLLTY